MVHLELTDADAQLLKDAFRESIDYLWIELHASKNTLKKIRLRKKLMLLRTLNAMLAEQSTLHAPKVFSVQR